MSGLQRQDCFPTPLWQFTLAEAETLNAKLAAAIARERERDPEGMKVSNVLGWHSQDDLHRREEFREFVNIVGKNILTVVRELAWDLEAIAPKLNNCWAMANIPNSTTKAHHHPNSVLSGVYYVSAPAGSGNIFFFDPRPGARMLVPPNTKDNALNAGQVTLTATAGQMVIFPSWLWHGVGLNRTTEDRLSVSFNIGIAQKPKPQPKPTK